MRAQPPAFSSPQSASSIYDVTGVGRGTQLTAAFRSRGTVTYDYYEFRYDPADSPLPSGTSACARAHARVTALLRWLAVTKHTRGHLCTIPRFKVHTWFLVVNIGLCICSLIHLFIYRFPVYYVLHDIYVFFNLILILRIMFQ